MLQFLLLLKVSMNLEPAVAAITSLNETIQMEAMLWCVIVRLYLPPSPLPSPPRILGSPNPVPTKIRSRLSIDDTCFQVAHFQTRGLLSSESCTAI